MEYCCHAWACAAKCYMNMSNKLLKRACWAFDTALLLLFSPWLIVKIWLVQICFYGFVLKDVNSFIYDVKTKCSHRKIFKICLAIFQHY